MRTIPFGDSEYLQFPTQMQLSEKRKRFSHSFVPFMKSSSNFKHFWKKGDRDSSYISEITDCQRLG